MQVLVVEDDLDSCEMLEYYLKSRGHTATSRQCGADAFAHLLVRTPDVVLLDLTLPDFHGDEVIARLRMVGGRVPPIILMSAWPPAVVEETARRLHPIATLIKPFALTALTTALALVAACTVEPAIPLSVVGTVAARR